MSNTCVLIGDIRGSRNLGDWSTVFGNLESALREVNAEFADDVVVAFGPTVGDEFQGALRDATNAYEVYLRVKGRLPTGIYCGIGVGDVEKPLGADVGMRGSAFYRARGALEECKAKGRSLLVRSSDDASLNDRVANTLLHLIEVLEGSWTDRQSEVLGFYRSHPEYTYEKIGSHFGISKQAVSQILKAADWRLIREAETLLHEWLEFIALQQ